MDNGQKKITQLLIEKGMITQMDIMNNDTSRVFKLLQPKLAFGFLYNGD